MGITAKRLITPEERVVFSKTCTIGFVGSTDVEENLEKLRKEPPHEDDELWGAVDDEGRITATMLNHHYRIEFDGRAVDAGGVGGVSSFPEFRSKGAIRTIFKEQFADLYDRGFAFSFLYPFSHPFYNQFGYAHCLDMNTCTIDMESLSPFSCGSTVRMVEKELPLDDLAPVHEAFGAGKNLFVHRKGKEWDFLKSDPYKDRKYLYVFYDADKIPRAYLCFVPEDSASGRVAAVVDMACRTPADFFEVLGFLYRLRAQYAKVRLELPASIPLNAMLREPYNCEFSVRPPAQARVIHARRVLEGMRYPAGNGSFTVALSDPFLPQNTGRYTVSYEDGKGKVEFCETAGEADLKTDIQTFTQLVLGVLDIPALSYLPGAAVCGNGEILKKVFVKKEVYFNDRF